MTLHACLKSMRLRTLPLSLSGIIAGIALTINATPACQQLTDTAAQAGPTWLTIITLILTACLLQILSNLSNELGDTLHGTDTAEREGMHYSIQDGEMTVPQMKRLIAIIAALCCLSGLAMIISSFAPSIAALLPEAIRPAALQTASLQPAAQTTQAIQLLAQPIAFLILGAAAIWAAMHYTLGDNPYGYRGLGDIFVFIFFGLVAVLGSAYICAHRIEALWIFPACGIGFWSIGVLNVNNIRDMKTDAATRTTVALKMGAKRARLYQCALITLGWAAMISYSAIRGMHNWLFMVTIPLFALHLRGVYKRNGKQLDPMLPLLVMSTFLTTLLFAVGEMIS